jgi:hypothetical protein
MGQRINKKRNFKNTLRQMKMGNSIPKCAGYSKNSSKRNV